MCGVILALAGTAPRAAVAQERCPRGVRLSVDRDFLRGTAIVVNDTARIWLGRFGKGVDRVPWSVPRSRDEAEDYKIARRVSTTFAVATLVGAIFWERETRPSRGDWLRNRWAGPTIASITIVGFASFASRQTLKSAVRLHNSYCE
jgi:hypothetical protein